MNQRRRREEAARSAENRRTLLVVAGVLALIAILAIAAVIIAADDDDDDGTASDVSSVELGGEGGGDDAAGDAANDPSAAAVEVSGDNLPPLEDPANDPAVGMAAPALSGTDYDGQPVELRPGTDGPTMVVFLAHWCPHCNDEIPVLNEWRDSGQIPENLRIVGVSTAVAEDRPNYPPDEWLAEKDWQWDVIADGADGRAMDAYGVTGFPFFVMIEADGNVAVRGSGEQPIEILSQLAAMVTA